jgi:hypothetical protein
MFIPAFLNKTIVRINFLLKLLAGKKLAGQNETEKMISGAAKDS